MCILRARARVCLPAKCRWYKNYSATRHTHSFAEAGVSGNSNPHKKKKEHCDTAAGDEHEKHDQTYRRREFRTCVEEKGVQAHDARRRHAKNTESHCVVCVPPSLLQRTVEMITRVDDRGRLQGDDGGILNLLFDVFRRDRHLARACVCDGVGV